MTQGNDIPEIEGQIPEESPTRQQVIPFMGDDLAVAMTTGGGIYVALPGMCTALGLDHRSQLRRIRRTRALNAGIRKIPLETRGGTQAVNCLSIDKVALWLAGIQTMQVSPGIREKIERYQDELAPVATRVFMQVMGIATTPPAGVDPRLTILAEQYDVLMATAAFIAAHMESLAALPGQVTGVSAQLDQAVKLLESLTTDIQQLQHQQTLTPAQKQHIKEAVQRIVEDSVGKPGEMTHTQVYGTIFHRFRVNTYTELPAARYEEVMMFLRDLWKRATTGKVPEQESLF